MKKIIIMAAAMLLFIPAIHATEVPDAIENAFRQKFPEAKKVKWEREKNKDYEASFLLNNKEVSAVYSPEGELKETETAIAVADLPAALVSVLNKKYPGAVIKEAEKVERADASVLYEVEIKFNKKEKELLLDAEGNESK